MKHPIFNILRFSCILLAFCVLSGCGGALRDADLVFVRSSEGEFSSAIAEATDGYSKDGNFDHVGIIERDTDSLRVIEARPGSGVIVRSLSDFIEEHGAENIVFMRLEGLPNSKATVARARSFIGREYDFAFLPGDAQIYCSELVQLSFLDRTGEPIFTSIPMNFRRADGSMPEFWTNLYANLCLPIPEGAPGTNPNQIAADPRLRLVKNYLMNFKAGSN